MDLSKFVSDLARKRTFADDDDDRELFELKGVEIFRTGRWKGKDFDTGDLDAMVDSFGIGPDKAGFRPPVKLGHLNKSGDPAFGWVGSIRREGTRLVADLIDLPKEVFDAIRQRRFDAVSAEIAFDMEVNGKIIPLVLLGIALLGSQIPAVAGLKPLRDIAADLRDIACGERAIFTLPMENNMDVKNILAEHPGAITRLQAELEHAQRDGDESQIVAFALDLASKRVALAEARAAKAERDKETSEKLFAMQAEISELSRKADALNKKRVVEKRPGDVSEMSSFEAGVEIHSRIEKHLKKHAKATYPDGYKAVLSADPELATAYLGWETLEIIAANTPEVVEPTMPMAEAGVELAKRINTFMLDHDKADYRTAKSFVLDADPQLKASYVQMVN